MNLTSRMRVSRMTAPQLAALPLLLAAAFLITGCETTGPSGSRGSLATAYEAYNRGDFAAAYSQSKPIADAYGTQSNEAAYLTGLAAFQLKSGSEAERYLQQAARGEDRTIGGQSMAMIGRIYAGQNRHERAIESYAGAAQRLTGEDRANALFHTAMSQQSLGQWQQAQTNLTMAKQASKDAELIKKVDSYLAVRAWTIQLGAYTDQRNAETAARNIAAKTTGLAMGAPRLVPATDATGKRLILLQVGQFPNEPAAIAARNRLSGGAEVVPLMAMR